MTAGEDRTLNLIAKDRDQAVFDLTGASLKLYLVNAVNDRVLEEDGTISVAASGTWTATIDDSESDKLQGLYELVGLATISGSTTRVNGGTLRVRSSGNRLVTDYGRP